MKNTVSKSRFKPKALEYFRRVEETGVELTITDHGRPVVKIVPYIAQRDAALKTLRKSVLAYKDPLKPVGAEDWNATR